MEISLSEMAMSVSKRSQEHIAVLFPPEQCAEVAELLVNECGNNLPFCKDKDEFQLERFQFAALKVSEGNLDKLKEAIKIAKQDWRDLLLWADFGNPEAHLRWDSASEKQKPGAND